MAENTKIVNLKDTGSGDTLVLDVLVFGARNPATAVALGKTDAVALKAMIANPVTKTLTVKNAPASPYALETGKDLVILAGNDDVCNLPAATGSGRVVSFLIQGTVANIYPHGTEQIDALGAGTQLQIWAASPRKKLVDAAVGQWFMIA